MSDSQRHDIDQMADLPLRDDQAADLQGGATAVASGRAREVRAKAERRAEADCGRAERAPIAAKK